MTPRRDRNHLGLSQQPSGQAQSSHAREMLTWKLYILLGILLSIIFYWIIPTWLNDALGTFQHSTARPIAAALFARRIYWIQLAGVILGFGCILFAIRNYLTLKTLDKSCNHTFLNRLFAKLID